MTNTRKFLLAGAALALTATAAVAANLPAKKAQLPHMVQAVAYSEDVLPRFAVLQDDAAAPDAFAIPAFADMARMAAVMDRMMAEAGALMTMPDDMPRNAVLMGLPDAHEDYSVMTAIGTGANACGREVTITSTGKDSKPKIVSRSFGNCGNSVSGPSGAAILAPRDAASGLMQARFIN